MTERMGMTVLLAIIVLSCHPRVLPAPNPVVVLTGISEQGDGTYRMDGYFSATGKVFLDLYADDRLIHQQELPGGVQVFSYVLVQLVDVSEIKFTVVMTDDVGLSSYSLHCVFSHSGVPRMSPS